MRSSKEDKKGDWEEPRQTAEICGLAQAVTPKPESRKAGSSLKEEGNSVNSVPGPGAE